MTTPFHPFKERGHYLLEHGTGGASGVFNSDLSSLSAYATMATRVATFCGSTAEPFYRPRFSRSSGNPTWDSGNLTPWSWSNLRDDMTAYTIAGGADADYSTDHKFRRVGLSRAFRTVGLFDIYQRGDQQQFPLDPQYPTQDEGDPAYIFDLTDGGDTADFLSAALDPAYLQGLVGYVCDNITTGAVDGVNGQTGQEIDYALLTAGVLHPTGRPWGVEGAPKDAVNQVVDDTYAELPYTNTDDNLGDLNYLDLVQKALPPHVGLDVQVDRGWAGAATAQITKLTQTANTGTFTITLGGSGATASLAWNATGATIAAAIEAEYGSILGFDFGEGVQKVRGDSTMASGGKVFLCFADTGSANALSVTINNASGADIADTEIQPAQDVNTSGDDDGLTDHRAAVLRQWDAIGIQLTPADGTNSGTVKIQDWCLALEALPTVRKQQGVFVSYSGTPGLYFLDIRLYCLGGYASAPSYNSGPGGITVTLNGSPVTVLSPPSTIAVDPSKADGEAYWARALLNFGTTVTDSDEIQVTAPAATWTHGTNGDSRRIVRRVEHVFSSANTMTALSAQAPVRFKMQKDIDGAGSWSAVQPNTIIDIGDPTPGTPTSTQVKLQGGNESQGTDGSITSNEMGGHPDIVAEFSFTDLAGTSIPKEASPGSTTFRTFTPTWTPSGRAVRVIYTIKTNDLTNPYYCLFLQSSYSHGFFTLYTSDNQTSDNELKSDDSISGLSLTQGEPYVITLHGFNAGDGSLSSVTATTLPSSITMQVYGCASGAWTLVDDISDLDAIQSFDSFKIKLTVTPDAAGAYSEDVVFNHGGKQDNGSNVAEDGPFTLTIAGTASPSTSARSFARFGPSFAVSPSLRIWLRNKDSVSRRRRR